MVFTVYEDDGIQTESLLRTLIEMTVVIRTNTIIIKARKVSQGEKRVKGLI